MSIHTSSSFINNWMNGMWTLEQLINSAHLWERVWPYWANHLADRQTTIQTLYTCVEHRFNRITSGMSLVWSTVIQEEMRHWDYENVPAADGATEASHRISQVLFNHSLSVGWEKQEDRGGEKKKEKNGNWNWRRRWYIGARLWVSVSAACYWARLFNSNSKTLKKVFFSDVSYSVIIS